MENPEQRKSYEQGILQTEGATCTRARDARCASDQTAELRDPAEDSEQALAQEERVRIARRILNALPEIQRETLIRFYLKEQRPDEIQAALGLTGTQFGLIKSRAKARFAELCRAAEQCHPR